MTLAHLFLIYRYKVISVHYVSPTDDNHHQTEKMVGLGIFEEVHNEVGQIIVASVNSEHINVLLNPDRVELNKLIAKQS
jgi:isocitrate lyase